jgi:hypothetical protein
MAYSTSLSPGLKTQFGSIASFVIKFILAKLLGPSEEELLSILMIQHLIFFSTCKVIQQKNGINVNGESSLPINSLSQD